VRSRTLDRLAAPRPRRPRPARRSRGDCRVRGALRLAVLLENSLASLLRVPDELVVLVCRVDGRPAGLAARISLKRAGTEQSPSSSRSRPITSVSR
jgi:hypothetical protein